MRGEALRLDELLQVKWQIETIVIVLYIYIYNFAFNFVWAQIH